MLALMRHRGEVRGEGRGPEILRSAGRRRLCRADDDRLQRREDALPVGLPDVSKAQRGRDQIGGERLQIADERISSAIPPRAATAPKTAEWQAPSCAMAGFLTSSPPLGAERVG